MVHTFDRDRCRFFEGMSQSVSIMFLENKTTNGKCKFYTSRMFRKTPDFRKIKCSLANNYLLGNEIGVPFTAKHRLPKIGDNVKILEKIIKTNLKLKDLLDKNGEKIWIRTSGNYWYNAWNKKPYKSSKIRSEFVDKEFTNFFLVLINSSIFYIWLRIYGDGRDMNKDIMKNFPIPPLDNIKKTSRLWDLLSSKLMRFLWDTLDAEEGRFETSKVKIIIDLCDIAIGRLYPLTANEIDYILNYDENIRKGRKVDNWLFYLIDLYVIDALTDSNMLDYEFLDHLIDEVYNDKNNIPSETEIITAFEDQMKNFGLELDDLDLHDQIFKDISEKKFNTDIYNLKKIVELINEMRTLQ